MPMPINWTIFELPKTLDTFWTTFSVSIGLWIGHDLENFQILHH